MSQLRAVVPRRRLVGVVAAARSRARPQRAGRAPALRAPHRHAHGCTAAVQRAVQQQRTRGDTLGWRGRLCPRATGRCGMATGAAHQGGVAAAYEALVEAGQLQRDPEQERVVRSLQRIADELREYEPTALGATAASPSSPSAPPGASWLGRLFGSGPSFPSAEAAGKGQAPAVCGLYVHGGVGTGKTLVMDLFFKHVRAGPGDRRRRVHFHEFMLEVHARVQALKDGGLRDDPITYVAREIARTATLLCFDELQVEDVANAMILRRLFDVLFGYGVVVVATSNRAPADLYKNGLQRASFLPFIALVEAHCEVVHVRSTVDYRTLSLQHAPLKQVFLHPNSAAQNHELGKLFAQLAGPGALPTVLDRDGRTIPVVSAAAGVAMFDFPALCEEANGAVDYLAICEAFHTVVVRDIPIMSLRQKNAARRFITLIDCLYDSNRRLVCSAADSPELLFVGDASEAREDDLMRDDLKLEDGHGLFTGEEELFAFQRVVSRLREMQTADYWDRAAEADARRPAAASGPG